MRRSHLIVFISFMAILVAPHISYAALTGLNSAIFPSYCTCTGLAGSGSSYPSAPDWGCVLQIIQNVISAVVSFSTIIIAIFIARAGYMFMLSPNNEEAKTKARNSLVNAVIGILIVLGAYLLVDSVMKVIYNSSATGAGVAQLGPWNAILSASSANDCLVQRQAPGTSVFGSTVTSGTAGGGSASQGTGTVPIGKGGSAQCSSSNPACSTQALQSAGLTAAQAKAMSCIAVSESSGNPNTPNSNTGACGTFQITTQPGNWHNPAFHGAGCSVNTSCNDANCNMQTAIIMLNKQGYQPWTGVNPNTGQHWNPTAVQCVANYDPGH